MFFKWQLFSATILQNPKIRLDFAGLEKETLMNLKPRLLLLTTALMLIAAMGIWLLTERITLQVLEQWALRNFDTQVPAGKNPFSRPPSSARPHWPGNLPIRKSCANGLWQPDDPQLQANALAEMESFRRNFADQSFFVALRESGAYYHNNAANEFAGSGAALPLTARQPG